MGKQKIFWVVLKDNSSETKYRHDTLDGAKAEARRLAMTFPGVRFFVLQSVGAARCVEPTIWEDHDEIPF